MNYNLREEVWCDGLLESGLNNCKLVHSMKITRGLEFLCVPWIIAPQASRSGMPERYSTSFKKSSSCFRSSAHSLLEGRDQNCRNLVHLDMQTAASVMGFFEGMVVVKTDLFAFSVCPRPSLCPSPSLQLEPSVRHPLLLPVGHPRYLER